MDKRLVKELVNVAAEIKGVSMAAVNGYENQKGEIADYILNLGINHRRVLERDLNVLLTKKADIINDLAVEKFFQGDVERVIAKKIESIKKSLAGENERAKAQADAYFHIDGNNAMKIGVESLELYIYGYLIRKVVRKKGEYKPVNHRKDTIIGFKVDKYLKGNKFRNLKVSALAEFVNGGRRLIFG